jgi:hypothetical protein
VDGGGRRWKIFPRFPSVVSQWRPADVHAIVGQMWVKFQWNSLNLLLTRRLCAELTAARWGNAPPETLPDTADRAAFCRV